MSLSWIFRKAYELDPKIIKLFEETDHPQSFSGRIELINDSFTSVGKDEDGYHVLLADLGFNSVQLEEYEGFSWNKNSQLDMRYNSKYTPCS